MQAFDANGGRLVRALRRTLGRDVVLIGTDGLKPIGLLRKGAGRAADGLYLTTYLIPSAKLSRSGREFLREFQRSQPGGSSPYWALYAAQATELLLAAIARSDGTRASITRELFATRLIDGPLGPVAIDRNGDATPARVPVYRIDPRGGRGDPLLPPDLEGASIDRVITLPPALLTPTSCAGGVVRRQHVAGPVGALPLRHGGLLGRRAGRTRALDDLHAVDVARAVREDLGAPDADDELRAGEAAEQRVVGSTLGDAVEAQAPRPPAVEVDEEQPDVRVDAQVADRQVHAVAVVVGERDGVLVDARTKPGSPPLYEHCGRPSASAVARKSMSIRSMNARSSG